MRDYPLEEILLPMNAASVKDLAKLEALWDNPLYIAETKYDGSRYISVGGRFFSRRTSDIDGLPVEKTDRIPHLSHLLSYYPLMILDGEVYKEGGNSNDVTSVMGSLPERAVEIQKESGTLKYVIFDILRDMEGNWLLDRLWEERREILEKSFMMVGLKYVDALLNMRTSYVAYDNKREFYHKILSQGGEGVMLKRRDGLYVPDKRPAWNWVKVKKSMTDDVVIIGYDDPVREYTGKEEKTWPYWESSPGNKMPFGFFDHHDPLWGRLNTPVTKFYYHGWIGAIKFGQFNQNGKLVELGTCSGMSEEIREMISRNKSDFIGKVIEISAMEKTKDGYYRHPQFVKIRTDKSPKDCIIED